MGGNTLQGSFPRAIAYQAGNGTQDIEEPSRKLPEDTEDQEDAKWLGKWSMI